ncbi:MAG: creatininase family protein [Bacteroidales bacterium]|nr:creatininase family protein [Bacteroidales bacterium]MBK8881292.1 creatininase family protein [Bacteroidales bacterium]
MKPFILAETNWKTLRDQEIELAVLPWGATEAHNLHLPYSTDNVMVDRIAADAAQVAWEKGAKIIVLPAIPFGVNTGQMDIKLNINMNPTTQLAILDDITDVLNRHGIYRFLILNGHGGNDFRQMIRELGLRYPRMFICTCNWYKSFDNSDFFENDGGHADEMETSMMQYVAPELTLPLDQAGRGDGKKFRLAAFNEGWAWAERKWTQVTADTGIGNPYGATPEKGRKCFDAVVSKIGNMMFGLSKADINDMYE